MQPEFMNLIEIIAECLYPIRRQVLRHNVLYRVNILITMTINILILNGAMILKTLKNVNFILTIHFVNLSFRKRRLKLYIVRKSRTLALRE